MISKTFEECTTPLSGFKILESFSSQLSRELIRAQVESKYIALVGLYSNDLELVNELFLRHKENPPILDDLPTASGTISWCRGLIDRISAPMSNFEKIRASLGRSKFPLLDIEPASRIYGELAKKIRDFERQVYGKWSKDIESISISKLGESLLAVKEKPSHRSAAMSVSGERAFDLGLGLIPERAILAVNFDPALSSCVSEVKHLREFQELPLPKTATLVFDRKERYRQFVSQLNNLVGQYNTIAGTLLDVEKPLVNEKMSKINSVISCGLRDIRWDSENEQISQFVQSSRTIVKDLFDRLNYLKGNVKTIEKLINAWKVTLYKVVTAPQNALPSASSQRRSSFSTVPPSAGGDPFTISRANKSTRLLELVSFWRLPLPIVSGANPPTPGTPGTPLTNVPLFSPSHFQNREPAAQITPPIKVYSKWKSKSNNLVSSVEDIVDQGKRIHKILSLARERLQLSRSSPHWSSYVSFLNTRFLLGLYEAIKNCFVYMINSLSYVQSVNEFGAVSSSNSAALNSGSSLVGNNAVSALAASLPALANSNNPRSMLSSFSKSFSAGPNSSINPLIASNQASNSLLGSFSFFSSQSVVAASPPPSLLVGKSFLEVKLELSQKELNFYPDISRDIFFPFPFGHFAELTFFVLWGEFFF